MRNITPFILTATLTLGGCEKYYKVDDACAESLSGANGVDPDAVAALSRMNCYRRMAQVIRVPADKQVQIAAESVVSYVQQNPDWTQLIGKYGPAYWLTQDFENPGFTGANVYERLTNPEEKGGAGYVFYDLGGTSIWEYIYVALADDPTQLPSGSAAIDEMMRSPVFRQSALQPSWLDGAYAEADLDQQWFVDGGIFSGIETTVGDPVAGLAPYGRVYYLLVLYTAPHVEHSYKPVMLPVEEQVDVPLYSWSTNRDVVQGDGTYAPTQLSYPISLLMGAIDPANYNPIDQNQYGVEVSNASIAGPDGPLETEVIHPGEEADGPWPDGVFLRTTVSFYTRHPFDPATRYTLYADYTTPEGEFALTYSFTTARQDLGVDPNIGLTPATTNVARRLPEPTVERNLRHTSGAALAASAAALAGRP